MFEDDVPSMAELKQLAKQLQKRDGLKYVIALEQAAHDLGFDDYTAFVEQNKERQQRAALPHGLWQAFYDGFCHEAKLRSVEFSTFQPTSTGLGKSIIDATAWVRLHFASVRLHDYARQPKGPEHKVVTGARFLNVEQEQTSSASFYRPKTKNGDPRMWFKRLPYFAHPGDIIAIVVEDGVPCLINLQEIAANIANLPPSVPLFLQPDETRLDIARLAKLADSVDLADTPALLSLRGILSLLDRVAAAKQSLAVELYHELLRIAAAGTISTAEHGPRAVGRAVEQALGINPNSSKAPDYKGKIELKAARAKRNPTRQTLFAQVADWNHAKALLTSSAKILDEFGYDRGGHRRLYCSVSTKVANSQGLWFKLSDDESLLMEMHGVGAKERVVAVWPLALLADRLLTKHAETFWIKARSQRDENGVEHFTLLHATHTQAPLASQLLPLIREGLITMDHLIKRCEDGSVKEKGPLFKIARDGFNLLFPQSKDYPMTPSC